MKMPKIVSDKNICSGKPVIEGTRVPIDLILSKLAAGITHKEIIDEYAIRKSDILAVLSYAAKYFEAPCEFKEMAEKGLSKWAEQIEKKDRLTLEGLLKGVTKENIHREVDIGKLKERKRIRVQLPKLSAQAIDPRSKAGRIALARMIMKLFDLWGLNIRDRATLLGLSESSKRNLDRYRKCSPLPDRRDLLDRVANLLSIHRSLRILFPKNQDIAYRWPTTPNSTFNELTPVEVIRRKGFSGLLIVRHYLDSERNR